jgi:hypothetical protein
MFSEKETRTQRVAFYKNVFKNRRRRLVLAYAPFGFEEGANERKGVQLIHVSR